MLSYNKNLKDNSRALRKNLTDSENKLWHHLRRKQILGVQFYRQKPIGNYIVDFFAPRAKLVIEVDGSQHGMGEQLQKDERRDAYLAGQGLKILRFNSREALNETEAVIGVIYRKVAELLQITHSAPFAEAPVFPPFEKGGPGGI